MTYTPKSGHMPLVDAGSFVPEFAIRFYGYPRSTLPWRPWGAGLDHLFPKGFFGGPRGAQIHLVYLGESGGEPGLENMCLLGLTEQHDWRLRTCKGQP